MHTPMFNFRGFCETAKWEYWVPFEEVDLPKFQTDHVPHTNETQAWIPLKCVERLDDEIIQLKEKISSIIWRIAKHEDRLHDLEN